jgi:carboxypeptidase C (cathepsin A)
VVVADAHAPANINFDGSPSTATNVSSLIENRWSWSKAANVIYLEAPAGVGFSYSKVKSDLITGDNQTAADNLIALELFFKDKFPEYATNPFYVSGESYGGVYVPTLSLKIYQSGKLPQMRGYLVGNGVFDEEESIDTHVPFAYGHGFLSTASYNEIMKTCKGNYKNPTPECKTLLKEIDDNMVDVNGYDAYRTCYHPDVSVQQTAAHPYRIGSMTEMTRTSMMGMAQNLHVLSSLKKVTAGESVPCINSVLGTKFLNKESVRTALHVEQSPNQWQVCGGVEYKDDGVYKSLISVHKKMLAKYQPRVLVYNGDVDPGCNYLWAEASVQKFGLNVSKEWHPWVYGDRIVGEQLGGFMTEYTPNVSFVTVHGAGHMSPQWRPEAVFHMLSSFLN